MSGSFIVFEGGEGAGKSTQAYSLYAPLQSEGHKCTLAREPGGTPLGETVRKLLKKPSSTMSPLAELLLFEAARAQLVEQVIGPALDAGNIVICDRFVASTISYQGYGRGLAMSLIDALNTESTLGLRPDLTILLDVPIQTGLRRKSTKKLDAFESENQQFHNKVRQGYLAQVSQKQDAWFVVDGTLSKGIIEEQIWERLQAIWG